MSTTTPPWISRGCIVCSSPLVVRGYDDLLPTTPSASCTFCGTHARSPYCAAGKVVMVWRADQRGVACRGCDDRLFDVRERHRLEDTVRCTTQYSATCSICASTTVPTHQVMVEVDETVLARFFACTDDHLSALEGHLHAARAETCRGWCSDCNLVYSGDDSHPRYTRREPTLHVRRLYQVPPSWWRLKSWLAWGQDGVELAVEERCS
jgi:hypothetical protein